MLVPGVAWPEHVVQVKVKVAKVRLVPNAAAVIVEYLTANGPTKCRKMLSETGLVKGQVRWAFVKLRGAIEFEQVGDREMRDTLYWLKDSPPPTYMRSETYKTLTFFRANPWAYVSEIPAELVVQKLAYSYTSALEKQMKLISRIRKGRKQYKATSQ